MTPLDGGIFNDGESTMQSIQDGNSDALEIFAETTNIFLLLRAHQRCLVSHEIYIFDRASKVVQQTSRFVPPIALR
jgi:hypothetical protein